MSQTERGLTSEFGMGSGGSHALWPVTNHTTKGLFFKRFGGTFILELNNPEELSSRESLYKLCLSSFTNCRTVVVWVDLYCVFAVRSVGGAVV